jgi:hypothetical protein
MMYCWKILIKKKQVRIFSFSERHLKRLEKDSFEYNAELQFIKEREKRN